MRISAYVSKASNGLIVHVGVGGHEGEGRYRRYNAAAENGD